VIQPTREGGEAIAGSATGPKYDGSASEHEESAYVYDILCLGFSSNGAKFPGGETVQDLINSFVRLSAAMAVYSLHQMQSAVDTIDAKDPVAKLKKMIDSVTDALIEQIDESKKKTVDSISNLGADMVARTFDTVPGLKSHDLVSRTNDLVATTNDVVRKTTDSLASIIKPDKDNNKEASTGKHKSRAAEESHHPATH
jgi:hypothetical protein